MSKTDALRAIKQARAAAASAAAPARPPASRPAPARPAPARPEPPRAAPTGPAAAAEPTAAGPVGPPAPDLADLAPEPLCGHQAIGGRRCTRPKGHSEKNHRYAA